MIIEKVNTSINNNICDGELSYCLNKFIKNNVI